jgi:hypothetical protein
MTQLKDVLRVDVKGYEGLYQIDEFGNLFSTPRNGTRGGKLKPRINNDGYYYFGLTKNNITQSIKAHRLVGFHFLPSPENPQTHNCLNHKDGDKLNNHYTNLEWCTQKENVNHAWQLGLSKALVGEFNGNSKITDSQRVSIVREYATTDMNQMQIAKKYGVTQGNVSLIVKAFLKSFFESGQALDSTKQ